jgi:hypothetical protein
LPVAICLHFNPALPLTFGELDTSIQLEPARHNLALTSKASASYLWVLELEF